MKKVKGKTPRNESGPVGDPLEFQFFNEIGIIEQLARNLFEKVMPHGLSLAQFSVLNHFARLGGEKNLVELARAFQVTKAAMTRIIGKLQGKGFVRVIPNPKDGRGKLVSLTKAGARARDESIDRLTPVLAEFRLHFPAETIQSVIPALESVRIWLDDNRQTLHRLE